jgi:hypothetical protein
LTLATTATALSATLAPALTLASTALTLASTALSLAAAALTLASTALSATLAPALTLPALGAAARSPLGIVIRALHALVAIWHTSSELVDNPHRPSDLSHGREKAMDVPHSARGGG